MNFKTLGVVMVAGVALAGCEPQQTNCGNFSNGSSTGVRPTTPAGPTAIYCAPVTTTTLDNRPGVVQGGNATGGSGSGGNGSGGQGGSGGSGQNDGTTGTPNITSSGVNSDNVTIWQIGRGSSFVRTGGDVWTVWCRPNSDCNGLNTYRTDNNVASPPPSWVDDGYAWFRRSVSTGTSTTFVVDGVTLVHTF